jgi:hypothetical protein
MRPTPKIQGERHGNLVAIRPLESNSENRVLWVFKCDCGEIATLRRSRAKERGHCGCLKLERYSRANTRHGKSFTPEYKSWTAMKQRCLNPNGRKFLLHGGRGITVCERWRKSFVSFLDDMGTRPPGTTLERKNNNGNYEPGNCRWATPTEQNRNKRTTRKIIIGGLNLPLTEWAERNNLHPDIIRKRILSGCAESELFNPSQRTK